PGGDPPLAIGARQELGIAADGDRYGRALLRRELDADGDPRLVALARRAVRLFDLEQLHRRGNSDVEGLTAAAAPLLVGIAEGEARLQLVFDIVHFGADDEHRRLRIDEDRDALGLDHLVELALLVGIFERVGEPRAAAAAHADADADRRLAAPGQQRLDALRRRIRHHHRLPQRHRRLLARPLRYTGPA